MSRLNRLIYIDIAGRWRWQVVADNNRIVAASSQSFSTKWSAKRNMRLTLKELMERMGTL